MDNLSTLANVAAEHIRQQPVAAVLLSLVAIAVTTRLWTAYSGGHDTNSGAKTVPAVPYWLPVIGHIPQMVFGGPGFMAGLRKRYPGGIFSLNFGGSSHIIIFRPELGIVALNKSDDIADGHGTSKRTMRNDFVWPKGPTADARLDALADELLGLYHSTLQAAPVIAEMMAYISGQLRHTTANFVTFNKSAVDQMPWERMAGAEVVEDRAGSPVVEADLVELVRSFVGCNSLGSFVGTDFLDNFPDFMEDLWIFDEAFLSFVFFGQAARLLPTGSRAHAARSRLLAQCREFEVAMDAYYGDHKDPGPAWQNLDNVSATLRARIEPYRRLGNTMDERASIELGAIWGMVANASLLVFWLVLDLAAHEGGDFLRRVRDEIAPHVVVAPPRGGFGPGVAEAPVLDGADVDALMDRCPLLKAAYIETLRVHVAAWTVKTVRQDFVVGERGGDKYHIPKGSFAHVAHELHHTDPARWDDPETWRPERHLRYGEDGKCTADMGTVRPYGGGTTHCKGRAFASREILLFAAAIITMWDIEPAGGGPWKMPKHARAAGTLRPVPFPKAWVRRRDLHARS